jgi:hypothetical protein
MSGYGDDVVRCEWSVKDMKRKRKSAWSNIGFSQMPKEFRPSASGPVIITA